MALMVSNSPSPKPVFLVNLPLGHVPLDKPPTDTYVRSQPQGSPIDWPVIPVHSSRLVRELPS